MSYAGLASGLYAQIREYAELLDSVLLDLKAGTPDAHREERLRLGRLLAGSSNRSVGDMPTQLLASLLRQPGDAASTRLSEIGRALLDARVSPELVTDMESLARTLEEERAGIFAKIRGAG